MPQEINWEEYLTAEDRSFPPATDQQVIELEERIMLKLPDDYKAALKKHQGKVPVPEGVPIGDGGSVFGCLYHALLVGPEMSYSIATNIARLEREGFKNYVPFSEAGNSYYCFDYNDTDENPPVVFINGDFQADDPRSIIPLASSFTELLDMLEE